MPGRFIRHARSKSDWGTQPPRSAERREAVSEPAKRVPGRKDRKHWCRGREGVPHVPALVLHLAHPRDSPCRWGAPWSGEYVGWSCRHREVCESCGRVLREPWQLASGECPRYPGSPGQRAVAEAEAAVNRERYAVQRAGRRRIIDGPQGYRRRSKERA